MSNQADRATSLTTPLAALLGIRYPIIQSPMAGATTPEMVAAVSNAGGLGMLPAARVPTPLLEQHIRQVKALTSKPFGVNWQLAPVEPGNRDVAESQRVLDPFRAELGLPPGPSGLPEFRLLVDEQLELVLAEGVRTVSVALGDPARYVERVHRAGGTMVGSATTVMEAVAAEECGCDAVVAQGAEAGGHRATFHLGPDEEPPLVGTLALVPQVVDAVRVPVIAAGGIMDGRGVAAALALGALGAQLGTRFLLAKESGASAAARERLLRAIETTTVVTRAFSGRPARGLRNRIVDAYAAPGAKHLAWPFQNMVAQDVYQAAREKGETELMAILAGQGTRMLKEGQSAGDIVEELVAQARTALERLSGLL